MYCSGKIQANDDDDDYSDDSDEDDVQELKDVDSSSNWQKGCHGIQKESTNAHLAFKNTYDGSRSSLNDFGNARASHCLSKPDS